jgi:rhodanese-related sulfurtransferase
MNAIITILGLLLLLESTSQPPQEMVREAITVGEAYQLIERDTNVVILDVRTPAEYRGELGHVKGSMLIPVQELEERLGELEPFRDKTILAICRSGNRSGRAAKLLNEKGFKALNVEGGMLKWNKEGLPVVKEK